MSFMQGMQCLCIVVCRPVTGSDDADCRFDIAILNFGHDC
jgi:hypothetical protein